MDEKKIIIRAAAPEDLAWITRLYADYMFDSYFLQFGSGFIQRYLKAIISSSACLSLVAVEEGQIAGFIMATLNSRELLSRLISDPGIWRAWLKQAFKKPTLIFEAVKLLLYPFWTQLRNTDAEFLFIVVAPDWQRKHLAKRLINELIYLMKTKGAKKAKVTTLAQNTPVNALLDKLGFKKEQTFKLLKKVMNLYSYGLSS